MEAKDLLEFVRQRDPTCANAIEFYMDQYNVFMEPQSIRIPFDQWWDTYGCKREKQQCIKEYKKLSDYKTQLVLQKTIEYVETLTDRKFIKKPIDYLKDRNYEDEGFIEDVKCRSGKDLRKGDITPEGIDRILHK